MTWIIGLCFIIVIGVILFGAVNFVQVISKLADEETTPNEVEQNTCTFSDYVDCEHILSLK